MHAQTKLPDSEVRIRPDYLRIHPEIEESRRGAKRRLRERWFVWHGILFEEPNPTGSRTRDLIGLEEQHMKPHPPNTQGRARRKHRGDRGHPEEAESHPEEAERRRKDRKLEAVLKIPRSN